MSPSFNHLRLTDCILAVALACLPVVTVSADDAATPFVPLTFAEACDAAAAKGRLLFAYFSAAGDNQCAAYEKLTLSDADVRRWIDERFVAIELEKSSTENLRKRFDVMASPTVLVLTPQHQVRARIVGYRDPAELREQVESALSASDPVQQAKRRVEASNNDPSAILTYAKSLEDAGRLDEALKQYDACFRKESANASGFGGALLVVLDELGRLALRSPQARQQLSAYRDAARKRLLARNASRTDPAVLAMANAHLSDIEDTLAVYHKLAETNPHSISTRLLRECVVDSMLAVHDYNRADRMIDAADYVQRAYGQFRLDVAKPVPTGTDYYEFRAFQRRSFIERVIKYYEILVGTARDQEAEEVASILLKVDDGPDTLAAMARAGLRTTLPTDVHAHYMRQALAKQDCPTRQDVETLARILLLLDRREEAVHAVEEYAPEFSDPDDIAALRKLLEQ